MEMLDFPSAHMVRMVPGHVCRVLGEGTTLVQS
jgi:hypothetical protein